MQRHHSNPRWLHVFFLFLIMSTAFSYSFAQQKQTALSMAELRQKARQERERIAAIEKRHSKKLTYHNGRLAAANEILVKFKAASKKTNRESVHAGLNSRVVKRFATRNLMLVKYPAKTSLDEALSYYRSRGDVEYAEPDYLIQLPQLQKSKKAPMSASGSNIVTPAASQYFPNDPMFSEQWALHNTGQNGGVNGEDINGPEAWMIEKGSSDVIVAIIDTGVDYNHEDLVNQMWQNTAELNGNPGEDDDGNGYIDDIYGINAINGTGNPLDDNKHGTHCAGIVAAEQDNSLGISGIAPGVKIMALKFLDQYGDGYTSDAIECTEYASEMGASIINNSWGGGGHHTVLYDVIKDFDGLVACAAGNDDRSNDDWDHFPSSYDLDNILAVISTDKWQRLSWLSNYGEFSVDVGAPGYFILSTVPGNSYEMLSGTSMATPYAVGVAALLLSRNPGYSAADLKGILLSTGDSLTEISEKCSSGKRVNAYNSLVLANLPPQANNVTIDGVIEVGETITANYQYSDQENNPEGDTIFHWYMTGDNDGNRLKRMDISTKSFTLQPEHGDKYLKVEVIPVASSGTAQGSPSFSALSTKVVTDMPVVDSGKIFVNSQNYAQATAMAWINSGTAIEEQGFYFSKSHNVTTSSSKAVAYHVELNTLFAQLDNLESNTKYYFRSFATNSHGTTLGDVKSFTTLADDDSLRTKIYSTRHNRRSYFGGTVDVCGDEIMVSGMFKPEEGGFPNGCAIEMFKRDARGKVSFKQIIYPFYGNFTVPIYNSAKIDGTWMMVGYDNSNEIKVYKKHQASGNYYSHSTITLPSNGGDYCNSLEIAGDLAFIGYTYDDTAGQAAGAVYCYQYNSGSDAWEYKDIITASDPLISPFYGARFSYHNDRILISAYNHTEEGTNQSSGKAYWYQYNNNTWEEVLTLKRPSGDYHDQLGVGVALNGNFSVVGIPGDDSNGERSGEIDIYRVDPDSGDWEEWQIFRAQKPGDNFSNSFGNALKLTDRLLAVGSGDYLDQGAVFTFVLDQSMDKWVPYKTLVPDVDSKDVAFGVFVDYDSDILGVGAHQEPDPHVDNYSYGTAYLFEIKLSNFAPVAGDLNLAGDPFAGDELTASYSYSDYDDDPEGISQIRWHLADDASGTNSAVISGANSLNYKLSESEEGKFMCFSVVPVAQSGTSPGTQVFSSWSGPVIIRRGSLQIHIIPEEANNAGAMWRRVGTTEWKSSGDVEELILAGNYQVEFKEITGWEKPAILDVTIEHNVTFQHSAQYTAGALAIAASDIKCEPGAAGEIEITINNGDGIGSFSFDLIFDPDYISFEGPAGRGDSVPLDYTFIVESVNSSTLRVTAEAPTGTSLLNGAGTLANIFFKLSDDAETEEKYSISFINVSGDLDSALTKDGSIEALDCVIDRDINCDGAVTPGDALLVLKHYLGTELLTDSCMVNKADVNRDGNITPGDALQVLMEYLSK